MVGKLHAVRGTTTDRHAPEPRRDEPAPGRPMPVPGLARPDAPIRRWRGTPKIVPKPRGKANVLSGKAKQQLEDCAASGDRDGFQALAAKVYQAQPDQFVELLAYKLSKHSIGKDTRALGGKHAIWRDDSPEEAVTAALDQADLVGRLAGETQIKRIVDAARAGDSKSVASYFRLHPDDVAQAVADDVSERTATMSVVRALPADGWAKVAEILGSKRFIELVLVPLRAARGGVELMLMHPLTRYLERTGGKDYESFRDSVPMLRVADKGRSDLGRKKIKDPLDLVDKVFDAFVRNEGIDLSYYTNNLDTTLHIVTGGTEEARRQFDAQRELLNGGDKPAVPAKPATQCHNLLETLKTVLLALPGLSLDITSQDIAGVTLTRPLADLPPGLIDKSFGGNVYDEAGKLTGQICFTGDNGTKSHTWSVVNGKPYDPVMGTKGDEVRAAVDGEFEPVPDRPGVYREKPKKKARRYLVEEPGLRAAENSQGFGRGYRLTTRLPTSNRDRA